MGELQMSRFIVVASAVVALTACKQTGEAAWASQAADSSDVVHGESAMLITATDGIDSTMSSEQAAGTAADHVGTFYRPAGCLTKALSGNVLTLTFDDCTGPYGLVHVTGVVEVTYTIDAGVIGYHATSTGLHVNGAVVDIDNEGTYAKTGDTATIEAKTGGAGVGPRGNRITRNGTYTFGWNSSTSCMDLDGSWMTTVGALDWTTTVSGFHGCDGTCPASGSIRWENSHNGLTLSFDGTSHPAWSTDSGKSGTVSLFCQ